MKKATAITCLFLDIGGALLGNGWDHHACKREAKVFDPDLTEMEERHRLTFVHLRKPDADIFRLALDIAQIPADQGVSIENTPMFVQVAEGLGIRSILRRDYRSTCAKLASFGLQNEIASLG